MNRKVSIVIEKDENGYYAYCPELSGCQTQGDTFEEINTNIKEAVELYHEATIITRDKGDQAVLLSYSDYSALAETAYLLRSPVMAERLRDSLESFQQQLGETNI